MIDNKSYSNCCFTGYRPEKFPFELDVSNPLFLDFEARLFEQILLLAKEGCRRFYCGMAMGFDLIAGETILAVKNAFSEPLELICVLPFKDQSKGFTDDWLKRYNNILNGADDIVILSDRYFHGCYQERNIYMVDQSDYVVTWFDGQKGGTQNTIRYAEKKGRQIFNIYENPQCFGFQTTLDID